MFLSLVLQVCGILDVLLSLLKANISNEQLYTFLLEQGNVDVFYFLLAQKKFSDQLREKVFKVGATLLPLLHT